MHPAVSSVRDNRKEILLILAAVLFAYGVTVSYGFLMDDFGLVADNPNIKSLGRVLHIFASGYWDSEGYTRGLYRPLDIFSYLLEYTLFGARPFIYHLDNTLLHFFCSVLVYFILREILPKGRAPLYAAVIFAVHPVHVEAVDWISSRGELLSAVFSLLTVLAFIKRRNKRGQAFLAYVFFFLGLLSKESAAVIPVLLLLYMLVFEREDMGRGRVSYVAGRLYPFAAIFALFLSLRFLVLGRLSPAWIDQAFYGIGPYQRFLTMCRAVFEYIRLAFLPFDLRADYFFPPPGTLFEPKVLIALVAVAATFLLAPAFARRSRAGFFASAWFFVALLPVMNIIPANIIMAERVMYIPSLGVCMLLGMAAASVAREARYQAMALLPVSVLLLALTLERDRVWRGQDTYVKSYVGMLAQGISNHPDYTMLYKLMARMQSRYCEPGPEVDRAVFEAARRVGPEDFEIHSMLAWVYYCKSMPEKALSEIEATLKVFPNANYYDFAGKILLQLGRFDEALFMADTAIRMNPGKSDFYMNKGNILMEMGKDDLALAQFQAAARLDPDNHDAYLEQGIILDSKKQFAPAIEMIKKAVSLRPDIPDLHYFLAVAYLDAGRPDMAVPELRQALAIRPDYKDAAALLDRLSGAGVHGPASQSPAQPAR